MKYAFIESLRGEHTIKNMCKWLAVSRSVYYRWRNRTPSARAIKREQIRQAVCDTFFEFNKIYGSPRLTLELNDMGLHCSENHIAQIMRENGLKARNGKQFKYTPSPEAVAGVSENLLARSFTADRPNQKWVSDITYIEIDQGWVYLAVIMDLYSRQIIGWAMDDEMKVDLVLEAFNNAVATRSVKPGLLLHSDRGVQYRAWEYQHALETHQIQPSMSRKGNCWDNAAMESFFSRLKVECVYTTQFATLTDAYQHVFEYIEIFYNRVRRHSAIGYRSPIQHEQQYYAQSA